MHIHCTSVAEALQKRCNRGARVLKEDAKGGFKGWSDAHLVKTSNKFRIYFLIRSVFVE